MTVLRVTAVLASLAVLGALPRTSDAQPRQGNTAGRTLFTWAGAVDREVILSLDGNQLLVRGERGVPASRTSQTRVGAVPRADGHVQVRQHDGRGDVRVIQQPSARNNFITLIRIRDDRGGLDRYRISATWEPARRVAIVNDRRDDGTYKVKKNDKNNGKNNGNGSYGRNGLQWTGVVDDVVDVRVQGRRVQLVERSGARTFNVRSDLIGSGLDRASDGVRLVQANGRGSIAVIEQPAPWNKYTAVVRIRDSRSGAAPYAFALQW